jgi:hypothetical protein
MVLSPGQSKRRGSIVSQAEISNEANFKDASTQLTEGLKSCRAVVENYRTIFGANWRPDEGPERSSTALNDNLQK